MANILSYFTYKIAQSDRIFYSYSKKNDNKDIYIYYKNEIILEICKNTNFCFILNCLSNIYKNMENNILIQLMTNKFDRNVLLNHKYIYYKQDKIVSFLKANLNFISYYLKFIGSIRYKYNVYISNSIANFKHIKYFYNKSIYIYGGYNYYKYTTYAILIPNKYELYYYSKYFHIYLAIIN